MSTSSPGQLQAANRILRRLPSQEYERLLPALSRDHLQTGELLYRPHEPLGFVYFPLDGVISLVARINARVAMEVAMIGNEGVAGLPLLLGADGLPFEAVVQIPGWFYRLPARDTGALLAELPGLHGNAQRYALALLGQVGQSLACNSLHPAMQRCARWLLMAHDRVVVDEIVLTHEYLSQMLGVRRATVSTVLGELRAAGMLDYRRGTLRISDRSALETAVCECYGIIRREHERLLPGT